MFFIVIIKKYQTVETSVDPRFYNDIGYHKGNFPLSMRRVLTRHFVRDFVTRGPIKDAKIDNMCNSAAKHFLRLFIID